MPYHKIRIIQENGNAVDIRTEPESFEFRNRDDVSCLCVGWCREDLIDHPREHLTISESWPGRETMELTDEEGYEVIFTGTVRVIGYDRKTFFLSAEERGS